MLLGCLGNKIFDVVRVQLFEHRIDQLFFELGMHGESAANLRDHGLLLLRRTAGQVLKLFKR